MRTRDELVVAMGNERDKQNADLTLCLKQLPFFGGKLWQFVYLCTIGK